MELKFEKKLKNNKAILVIKKIREHQEKWSERLDEWVTKQIFYYGKDFFLYGVISIKEEEVERKKTSQLRDKYSHIEE